MGQNRASSGNGGGQDRQIGVMNGMTNSQSLSLDVSNVHEVSEALMVAAQAYLKFGKTVLDYDPEYAHLWIETSRILRRCSKSVDKLISLYYGEK